MLIKKLVWIIAILIGANYLIADYKNQTVMLPPKEERIVIPEELVIITATPTIAPTAIPTKKVRVPTKVVEKEEWGVAKQIDEVTWTMKIEDDPRMATPREIVEALNEYRRRKGAQTLVWDDNLARLAEERAAYFDSIKSTDKHEGFKKYMDDNGFEKLRFTWVGENSSFGYKLEGVHLIEWVFAGDKPHDDNQSNERWSYVGVGVRGLGVDIIFGTGRSL